MTEQNDIYHSPVLKLWPMCICFMFLCCPCGAINGNNTENSSAYRYFFYVTWSNKIGGALIIFRVLNCVQFVLCMDSHYLFMCWLILRFCFSF